MTIVPLPPRGEWFGDARDGARALRVSWHGDATATEPGASDYVVLSTWRDDACVATTRLSAADAARLIGVLADGLAAATAPAATTQADAVETA